MKKKVLGILLLFIMIKTEAQTSVFTVVDSLLVQGKYQEALKKLEYENPKTTQVYERIGSIYYQIGDFNKAITYFNKGVELGVDYSTQIRLAKAYESIGKSKNAIEIYETIIQKDSLNLIAANALGKLYLSNTRPKSAEKIYRYLIKKDSLNPNFQYQLGRALMKKGERFDMVDYFLKAYELDSLHIKSIYRLAKFYKILKDKDSTLLFIDKGLEISPNDINFLQLKANYSYTEKEYRLAIEQLKKLIGLNYRNINIYDMFGMSYLKLEKLDSAKIYFKKALKIEFMDPTISYRMAKLYHEQDSLKQATYYAGMAVMSLRPDYDKEYYLLGILQKEQGELKRAITSFEKAYFNNYRNHKALFGLATTTDAYYKDKKIALKHYQKYISKFEVKDVEMAIFAKRRIVELKKELFLDGVKVE